MTARKRNWSIAIGLVVLPMAMGLAIAASVPARRTSAESGSSAIRAAPRGWLSPPPVSNRGLVPVNPARQRQSSIMIQTP